jgi:signal transduction histidine kinase
MFYPLDKQRERHPERELELALRDGHYEEEGWRVRKDGSTFWANVVITAVRDDHGRHIGFAKVTRDITERRRATEQRESAAAALAAAKAELETMNARLVQAAEEQAQFMAVTAHELRTPATVLGGSAKTLARHWQLLEDEERAELLDGMVTSADRLQRLLNDLLTAARLEAQAVELDPHPVPVAQVLSRAAATARGDRPDADVAVADADPALVVLADHGRFAQAVDNLVGNALRHGVPPVRLHAAAEGDAVVVRVHDAGPAVPEDMRPRLFERFVTGDHRRGTGLGLFIVRELARAHGGDAWYEHDDDGGSRFALSLPSARP